jgi:hypothetical protein
MRQKPARLPYSKMVSVERSRPPITGTSPDTSVSRTSEPASPLSTVFSPPSS